jgi:hypothetical protein
MQLWQAVQVLFLAWYSKDSIIIIIISFNVLSESETM